MNPKYNEQHEKSALDLAKQMSIVELCSQLRHSSKGINRLGIKSYNWWNESLHGVARAGVATVFPQAIAMASTFDENIIYNVASIISTEARAKYNENQAKGDYGIYKGLTMWSPNVNIFRDPRWGRGQETYGEDPYLSGALGTAFVKGLQGDDEKYIKTAGCVKHFAVHSGPEEDRHTMNVEISKKDLFETYLPAFKRTVTEGKACGVMGAYNRVNGEPCCASHTLIQKILRDTWGFDGYYVSDCSALLDIVFKQRLTLSPIKGASMAINNGCDLECGIMYSLLPLAYAKKMVSRQTLETSVKRLLSIRSKLGMFDENCIFNSISPSENATPHNENYAVEVARKAVVLLENDGLLPLKANDNKILVTGYNAQNDLAYLGNYNGEPSSFVKVLDGVKKYNKDTVYTEGTHLYENKKQNDIVNAVKKAKECDVILVCTGLDPSIEGEEAGGVLAGDGGAIGAQGDRETLELPKVQQDYLDELVKLDKKIVILNFSGGCIDFRKYKSKVNAIIQCWYPGGKGGQAIADVLFGKESPSGKLPITFYNSVDDLPAFDDYKMENRTYRYFKGQVQYPFGYGLTYTDFKLDELDFDDKNKVITASITNVGTVDCDEVLQLYVSYPKSNVELPIKSLIKTKRFNIKAGQSQKVEFKISDIDLYSTDENGNKVVLKGTYNFTLSDGQNISSDKIQYVNNNETQIVDKCPI